MNRINYQKELDKILDNPQNEGKKLFLHSCCAPCSSYVLTYLSTFFDITVFYYNPNIMNDDEYLHRVKEQIRLIEALNAEGIPKYPIKIIEGDHDVENFLKVSCGLEDAPEGGARCAKCFKLRLQKTLEIAAKNNADFFGTTLTISPLKNPEVINGIGFELEKSFQKREDKDLGNTNEDKEIESKFEDKDIESDNHVRYLPSDFKKKDGYKTSIELSRKYDLYRQDFCGCDFSKQQSEIAQ